MSGGGVILIGTQLIPLLSGLNIEVFGNVVTTRKGKYKVTYSVTDVLKRTSSVTITVTVQ